MLGWLKSKFSTSQPEPRPPEGTPRGILPTFVGDGRFVICKKAARVRNTYEVRLGLYFAVRDGFDFVLAVQPGAEIETSLELLLREQGGSLQTTDLPDYSVFVGHALEDGSEGSGWVLGDDQRWAQFLELFSDQGCGHELAVGAEFDQSNLETLARSLSNLECNLLNVDNENIREAFLHLIREAQEQGGSIYIQ